MNMTAKAVLMADAAGFGAGQNRDVALRSGLLEAGREADFVVVGAARR
jgi:hypothetical protein